MGVLKKLGDGAISNICKLAVCGAVALTCPPATAVAVGLSLGAKDIADCLFALGGAGAKFVMDWPKAEKVQRPLWEALAEQLSNEARFDLGSDAETSKAVAAFFDQVLLDISLPVKDFSSYRDQLNDPDGVYAGMAAAILRKLPGWVELDAGQQALASKLMVPAVKLAVEYAKAQTDLIIVILEKAMADNQAAHDKAYAAIEGLDAKMAAVLAAINAQGLLQTAKEENVSEAAVRAYLERLLEKGYDTGNITDWLPEWIEQAARVFRTGGNDDLAFQKAMAEADRLFESMQPNASQPIMDDLARLEAEESELKYEFKRRKIARIEKAIEIDQLELNILAIPEKLLLWAKLEDHKDVGEQIEFIGDKALQYWKNRQNQISPSGLMTARAVYDYLLDHHYDNVAEYKIAGLHNNLGNVLSDIGWQLDGDEGFASLKRSEAAYRAALEIWTRERFPAEWSMAQNNLGNILRILGGRLDGGERLASLRASEAAYRAALEIRTSKDFEWAQTQNNLGTVLSDLGGRMATEEGFFNLKVSETAFRMALEFYNRESYPADWAMAQANIGNVLRKIGERIGGDECLNTFRASEAAFNAALEVYVRQDFPFDWAMAQHNISILYMAIYHRVRDKEWLTQGLSAVENALEIYKLKKAGFFLNGATILRDQLKILLEQS